MMEAEYAPTTEGHAPVEERHRAEHPGTWLRLPCCEGSVHPVKIVSRADGVISISPPTEPHAEWIQRPEVNQPVTLGWSDVGGTLILDCIVMLPVEDDPTWRLHVVGTQDFIQRRRHVRVSCDATIQLMDGNLDRIISGRVLDISESGMKVEFDDYIPEMRLNPFQWALHLGDTSVVVLSEMKWAGRTGPLEFQAGFKFIETYDSLLTHLRSYVMLQLDTRGPIPE